MTESTVMGNLCVPIKRLNRQKAQFWIGVGDMAAEMERDFEANMTKAFIVEKDIIFGEREDLVIVKCMEVMLAAEPKSILINREDEEEENCM